MNPGAQAKIGPPKLTARQRVLAQWRGIDLTAAERTRAHAAKAVPRVVQDVLKEIGLDRRRADAEIVRVWSHLMDPHVSAHAQPTSLVRGTLFVSVDSSVWLDEIVRYRRREVLERLQHAFGREFIRRISFRVG